MLQVMGDDYIAQHVQFSYYEQKRREEMIFYLADGLWAFSNGKALGVRLRDLMHPQPTDTRTDADVRRDILAKLRGTETPPE